jgi:hypothetical protein
LISTIASVAIEPLTQADIIVANPVPTFGTNVIAGIITGIFTTYFRLVIPVNGMATMRRNLI